MLCVQLSVALLYWDISGKTGLDKRLRRSLRRPWEGYLPSLCSEHNGATDGRSFFFDAAAAAAAAETDTTSEKKDNAHGLQKFKRPSGADTMGNGLFIIVSLRMEDVYIWQEH